MTKRPLSIASHYRGSGKLTGKSALITGGDSGIGRAVAVHFAREGAHVAIMYLNEHEDARETQVMVESEGTACLAIPGDARDEAHCRRSVEQVVSQPGSVRSLQVLAVIKAPLGPEQVEQTKALIAAAVGASLQRGDVVVVQPLGTLAGSPVEPDAIGRPDDLKPVLPPQDRDDGPSPETEPQSMPRLFMALGALLLASLLALGWALARRRGSSAPQEMSVAQREAALHQVRQWLAAEGANR